MARKTRVSRVLVTGPAQVTAAVLEESTSVSVSTAQNYVSGLRAFMRFCLVEGLVEIDLSEAALSITGRRRSPFPRGIAKEEVEALLRSCERRTTIGRRDYAAIITLVRLGLHRGEVAGIRLDDIDWRAGELVVVGRRIAKRGPVRGDAQVTNPMTRAFLRARRLRARRDSNPRPSDP